MLVQKYTYEDLVIEAKYAINYVMIGMYSDGVKVHESINYLDVVKISWAQIIIQLIGMITGEPFDLKKLEITRTEYLDD